MEKSKIKSVGEDVIPEHSTLDDDLFDMPVSAKQREIRRRIEESIEAKRFREELGFDLD